LFQIIAVFLTAALPSLGGAQGLSIKTVSPPSATVGETVTVTITLQGDNYPPPNPSSITIGDISGTLVSWSEPDVKATFIIPGTASAGTQDVVVAFPSPSGDMTVTKSDGFSILPEGESVSIVYVNGAGTAGSPDGKSWSTAYSSLQDGIDLAALYGAEVWVVKGTYKPTAGTDRKISFELKSGVKLYGGFAGTETSRSQRNYASNETILSGEIGTSAGTDNSYHVLIGADNAILDGFTITGGYANGEKWNRLGGGMYNGGDAYTSPISPAISNCIFEDNYAESGGAIYNHSATPEISGCTFSGNSANYGGAVLFRVGSDATVSNCQFSENSAVWRGGAVYIDYGADPQISGCTFTSNTTEGNGGAVYIDDRASQLGGTYPVFTSCTFTGNQAAYRGGAFGAYNSSCEPTVSSSAFSNNTATAGGGAIACNYSVKLTLSGISYTGNTGGTGNANLDYDDTCTVIQK
jgi:predicted outer membrane repeat protein